MVFRKVLSSLGINCYYHMTGFIKTWSNGVELCYRDLQTLGLGIRLA